MIITITFTCLDLLILHQYLHVWLDSTLAWLTLHPIGGGLAFIGVFLLASLCFFPVGLLSLGAGYVYIELYGLGGGIFVSMVVCYFGCLLGAAVCFARSRYLMRQLIEKFSVKYPIVKAVDRAFETMGFRLFLLLRLSPAMPFNALNYIGGITAITFRNYWWATCAGIAPGLLWTIFIGATFGTVNKRGVDGKEEFDESSIRKGLVLGLGIGLGVMGLVGTGIYARRELTKIIIAEQMERATEEDELGGEVHLMNDECEEDEFSLSFEDLENPQLGESMNDFSLCSEDSREGSSPHQEVDALNTSGISYNRRQQKLSPPPSLTPEAVAAERPILSFPNILSQVSSPLESSASNNKTIQASMPPVATLSYHPDSDIADDGSVLLESTSSPLALNRRHSLQPDYTDNIKVSPMSHVSDWVNKEERNWPHRSAAPIEDGITASLTNIGETRAVTQALKIPIVANNQPGNRQQSNTEPAKNEHGNAPSAQGKRRQQSLHWTPLKLDCMRKCQSLESSTVGGQTQQQHQRRPSLLPSKSAERSRNIAHLQQQQSNNNHQGEGWKLASSSSMPLHDQHQQHNRPRSRSLSLSGAVLSPSGNYLELDIANNGDDVDGASREWFWIWA